MTSADTITIYHNPRCSTSRKVLDAIRTAGHEPVVVDYLKAGWQRPQLTALLKEAGLTPRQALRTKQEEAKALLAEDESYVDMQKAQAEQNRRIDPLVFDLDATQIGRASCRERV